MSLRMALLGLLTASGPASGYDLTKRFESSVNHAWHAGHSQIYPELAKMAADGLVTVGEEGPRGRKTYTVTEEGSRRLHDWLVTKEHFRPVRDEGALRAFLLPMLEPEESVPLLRREAGVYAARLAELEALEASKPRERETRFGRYALDLGIRQMRMMRDWAEETADRIERAARG
ncbi:PadR family transcriptional regulator [Planomonospora parontospora]|uniref:PadR family transcriptional regulator n=1 Tax=Planomonospora parontospora TaxID=58119 RepID=UPI001670EF52|nr:PadR family transcriptional regulator [Planomonospora parontospora]GGL05287.1 PadR family transcriptional regulator [Planomonospora parontospora subsp. antibiotica]GII14343.1 PadR family transcriptional regulator [Planomonospora parontospora subsp. antibiotica]